MFGSSLLMNDTMLKQPRTLVVGLGETGLSCARFLAACGVEVAVTDSRDLPPALARIRAELPDVPLFLGGYDAAAFLRAERILVSPGVSKDIALLQEARARGVEVIGDIELFARTAQAPVLAVTGSNGKSTVTTLLGAMARRAGWRAGVGGNLGTPALDLITDPEPDLYVLELSSFQLETVDNLAASVAAVLNISLDHMDRYARPADYVDAKRRVYRNAQRQIVNRDDELAAALADRAEPADSFGLSDPVDGGFGLREFDGTTWLVQDRVRLMPAGEVGMLGRHNLANALAALAIGVAARIPMQAMLQTLREFKGLPHRGQLVAESSGVRWYDDSKATNIGAALAAIRGTPGPLVLIAGGQGKGADFSELARGIRDELRAVVLIGEDAPLIAAALGDRVSCHFAEDMDDAVRRASELAQPGDAVLLSPACASLDMFEGFAARGDAFADAVKRWVAA
jgi:UDP-N-acetylmuramoylalanine--D-glutamate ligase